MRIVTLARKPFTGAAANIAVQWGCAGISVNGTRIPFVSDDDKKAWRSTPPEGRVQTTPGWKNTSKVLIQHDADGRWPANVILEGPGAVADVDEQGALLLPKAKRKSPEEEAASRFFKVFE